MPKRYEVTQAPSRPPTLFNGDKVTLYGIFRPKSKDKSGQQLEFGGIAILKGRTLDQPLKYTIPFQILKRGTEQLGGDSTLPIIHQLAAKSLIQEWQNGEGPQGFSADKMIINLSIESNVVSTHTAYVAVDEEQDKPISGAIKTWDITAAMAEQEGRLSWRGGGRGGGGGGMMRKKHKKEKKRRSRSRSRSRERGGEGVECLGSEDASDVTLSVKLKPNTTSDKHTALISLQQAEGNWQFNSTLATVLAKPLKKLESSCPVPCKGNIREVWATILALVFLETVCGSQKDEWELVSLTKQKNGYRDSSYHPGSI